MSSLGAVGAKVGMRVAGKMAASKIAASAVKSALEGIEQERCTAGL